MFRDIQVLFFLDKNQDFTLDLSVWAVVLQYIFYNKFFLCLVTLMILFYERSLLFTLQGGILSVMHF